MWGILLQMQKRKRRYSKKIGAMPDEPLYGMLVQVADDQKIAVS